MCVLCVRGPHPTGAVPVSRCLTAAGSIRNRTGGTTSTPADLSRRVSYQLAVLSVHVFGNQKGLFTSLWH